mgnify:FL=1
MFVNILNHSKKEFIKYGCSNILCMCLSLKELFWVDLTDINVMGIVRVMLFLAPLLIVITL